MMPNESLKGAKARFAAAIAEGVAPEEWAKANNVSTRTAFKWSDEPLVRKTVEAHRRKMIDQAIGRMAKHTDRAAEGILEIAENAEDEAVRLRARRAVFSDMHTASKYTGLVNRMNELERRLAERDGPIINIVTTGMPANLEQGAALPAMLPGTVNAQEGE